MTTVAVGIHVYEQPAALRETLASLASATDREHALVLLPDGADFATATLLDGELAHLPREASPAALGAPAAFNRLAQATDADVVVFLESGARVAPGWLEHLLAALDEDPRTGLAGPSTNAAWNEQCVAALLPDLEAMALPEVAAELERELGRTTRTLEPLHSLGDFCYAVRRAVIDRVGAADEAYGLGPCWEMDYNVRAARAGFRGVWASAAYVHRTPFSARRLREEGLRFDANRRRYQDKFCALRLRGERPDYEPHCAGETCEHFAPAALIQVSAPFGGAQVVAAAPAPSPVERPRPQEPRPLAPTLPSDGRLVSCIMPTGGRVALALQAVRLFQRQDWPERELIILDEGPGELAAQLPDDPRIRHVPVAPGLSIGAKRNRGCALARGAFIAHLDDDDWYAPDRLSRQLAPLLDGTSDVTALDAGVFFDLPAWRFWRCTPALHARLFVHDVHGGTLVFRRRVWEELGRYPDQSLAEDAAFLAQAVARGARLQRIENAGLFVYLRHGANAWSFACGEYLDPAGWREVEEPPLPAEDRVFFASLPGVRAAQVERPAARPRHGGRPLVTCIMPTADRRRFVPLAVRSFLLQDYPDRELVVVDDGRRPVADLLPPDPRIRYVRLPPRRSVGEKRNVACRAAAGDVIVHWDDDDWSAPHRLGRQVERLLAADALVGGIECPLFLGPTGEQAWQYVYPPEERPWVYGGTLAYTRAFWEAHPFPPLEVGEDNELVWHAPPERLARMSDTDLYVGLVHPGNTSPKWTSGPRWQPYELERVRALLGADWSCYALLLAPDEPAPAAARPRSDDRRGWRGVLPGSRTS